MFIKIRIKSIFIPRRRKSFSPPRREDTKVYEFFCLFAFVPLCLCGKSEFEFSASVFPVERRIHLCEIGTRMLPGFTEAHEMAGLMDTKYVGRPIQPGRMARIERASDGAEQGASGGMERL
jgi:hypothetical protein